MPEEVSEAEEREREERLDDLRAVIGRGVTFIQSMAFSDYLGELTFTATVARAINTIEQDESDTRPGRINSLLSLKREMTTAVSRARELPGLSET